MTPRHIYRVYICLLVFSFAPTPSLTQVLDTCIQQTSCSCKNSKGTIDLTPLANTAGSAKFLDQPDASGSTFKYSWNPCKDFTEGTSACTQVAACQSDSSTGTDYNLGDQASAEFVNEATSLSLHYSSTTDITRTTIVTLTCDETQEASLAITGEDPSNPGNYLMTLTSKYACPKAGPGPTKGPPEPEGGISIGSILVIVFFGTFVVYLAGGVVLQTFVRRASGRDMVPNYGLWATMFGLIKDGVTFTISCGRRTGYGKV
ncbi:cation-dependent mannose-6-phosphate receptor-like [Haliotis rubra]|uniref:cation-dependent mannose-6-phosphate receptor-like n=1 Tax=Haliotis rubra TaxID=36100 RepID=UPI001EE5603B|nr:cation-dependent mannose-6-phosphate receptor-like [Haliotis rubra]